MRPDAVVIGVGNPYRRDDGVGPAVVARLRTAGLPGATLAESDGEACALILLWQRRRLAVLVDAVQARPPHPGRVHRLVVAWPGGTGGPPSRPAASHAPALGDAVRLGEELDRLPSRMVVFAIETADTGFGVGLTPAVECAADEVARAIAEEVRGLPAAEGARAVPDEAGVPHSGRRTTPTQRGGAMHAQDIMSSPAHTVRADAPVADAVALLERYSITAVPVVDEHGALVGMLSERDVLLQAASVVRGTGPRLVRDIMAGLPVTAWPEADVADIAAVMVQRDAHTVPVVAEEHVVGVISRCDVLRTLLPTDEAARQEAQRRLDNYAGGRRRWTAGVRDGIATVTGGFDDDQEVAVAEALVRTTPGVTVVHVSAGVG